MEGVKRCARPGDTDRIFLRFSPVAGPICVLQTTTSLKTPRFALLALSYLGSSRWACRYRHRCRWPSIATASRLSSGTRLRTQRAFRWIRDSSVFAGHAVVALVGRRLRELRVVALGLTGYALARAGRCSSDGGVSAWVRAPSSALNGWPPSHPHAARQTAACVLGRGRNGGPAMMTRCSRTGFLPARLRSARIALGAMGSLRGDPAPWEVTPRPARISLQSAPGALRQRSVRAILLFFIYTGWSRNRQCASPLLRKGAVSTSRPRRWTTAIGVACSPQVVGFVVDRIGRPSPPHHTLTLSRRNVSASRRARRQLGLVGWARAWPDSPHPMSRTPIGWAHSAPRRRIPGARRNARTRPSPRSSSARRDPGLRTIGCRPGVASCFYPARDAHRRTRPAPAAIPRAERNRRLRSRRDADARRLSERDGIVRTTRAARTKPPMNVSPARGIHRDHRVAANAERPAPDRHHPPLRADAITFAAPAAVAPAASSRSHRVDGHPGEHPPRPRWGQEIAER